MTLEKHLDLLLPAPAKVRNRERKKKVGNIAERKNIAISSTKEDGSKKECWGNR